MRKLIRLELRRNKIKTYIMASLCIFITGLLFGGMLLFVIPMEAGLTASLIDSVPMPASIDMAAFAEWNGFSTVVSLVFLMSFAIMAAVMHARFTVEEYTGKRACLLFSYPQKRSQILFAKCSLVFWFNVVIMYVLNVVAILLLGLISNTFNILPNAFTGEDFVYILQTTALLSVTAGAIGLIALRIGFWRKSMIATVVAAVILFMPLSNLFSMFIDKSFIIMLVGMVLLLGIGLCMFFGLLGRVNKMEVLQ